MRRPVDQQNLRVLDRIDEIGRRRRGAEAGGVRQPPGLGRELDDVLLAFPVDDVIAQAATGDECRGSGNVAGSLQEVAGRKSPVDERAADGREVGIAERGPGLEVGAQHTKC